MPDDTAPNDTAPNDTAPDDTAPNDTAPNDTAPNDTAPNDTAPNDTAPNDTAPNDTAPNDTAPNDTAPDDTAPNDTAPIETAQNGGKSRLRPALVVAIAIFAVVALALVSISGWTLAHLGGEVAPPLWTEADLPTNPPATDNGWATLTREVRGSSDALPELTGERPLAERIEAFSWERTSFTVTEGAPRHEAARRMLERPRFVVACPRALGSECDVLTVVAAFRALWEAALVDAYAGRWDAALRTMGGGLERVVDGLRHADRLLTAVVFSLTLTEGARLAELLASRARAAGFEGPAPELTRALGAFPEAAEPFAAQAVRGEYVIMVTPFFEAMAQEQSAFVDRADTTEAINACHEALHAYAVGEGPSPEEPAAGAPFWAYNSRGRDVAAMMCQSVGLLAPRIHRMSEDLEDARRAAGVALDALRE